METLYQIHIDLMIYSYFPKDTLSVNFIFVGKVEQCLGTSSIWNIFVTDAELKSTHTLMGFGVHCVLICIVELSQHYASIKKVLTIKTQCEAFTFITSRQKCAILLQNCQENIYYFERHTTVKSSTNPFSIPFSSLSLPFSNTWFLLHYPSPHPQSFFQNLHIYELYPFTIVKPLSFPPLSTWIPNTTWLIYFKQN